MQVAKDINAYKLQVDQKTQKKTEETHPCIGDKVLNYAFLLIKLSFQRTRIILETCITSV